MGVDIKRTFFGIVDSNAIAVGSQVSEEGQVLAAVLVNGVEMVAPAQGNGSEKIAGFAVFRQQNYTTAPFCEDGVVPTAAPYTVDLSKNNLVTTQIRVHDVVGGFDYTVQTTAPTATHEVQVDYTNGVLTFYTDAASHAVVVYYRHNLTLAESVALYYQATPNYPDPNYFGSVGVGKGKGRVFTMYYDAAVDWTGAGTPPAPLAGANGMIVASSGTAIPGARVVQAPSENDPTLGIEFLV